MIQRVNVMSTHVKYHVLYYLHELLLHCTRLEKECVKAYKLMRLSVEWREKEKKNRRMREGGEDGKIDNYEFQYDESSHPYYWPVAR